MKKLVLVLLVAMLSVPAFAANPVITLVPVTSPANTGEVDVMYTADLVDANLLPSGFGLTVAVNSGAKIILVKNLNADFDIYPGSIDINDTTGVVDNVGSPVVGAVPTAADGSIILEMGALYKRGVDTPPAKSGKLCTIKVDKTCTVTVTGNDARCGTGKGIVAQNLVAYAVDADATVAQLVTIQTDCLYVGQVFTIPGTAPNNTLTVTATMVTNWTTLGKPACWCCAAQKMGNAVAANNRVDNADLGALKLSFGKSSTQAGYNPCADFNISARVDNADLGLLKLKFGQVVGVCP